VADDPRDDRAPGFTCPLPIAQYPQVLLAHGGGGTLMRQLIERMFQAAFGETGLTRQHDGALLDLTWGSAPHPGSQGGTGLGPVPRSPGQRPGPPDPGYRGTAARPRVMKVLHSANSHTWICVKSIQ